MALQLLPQQTFKIGWAQTDITPTVPVPNWGWTGQLISRKVTSRLSATAMAIQSDSGDMCAVIISCDLGAVNFGLGEDLRNSFTQAELAGMPGLYLDRLFLIATHTHCAPFTFDPEETVPPDVMNGSQYRAFLLPKLKQLTIDAWNNRGPAKVRAAQGNAAVGWCRILSKPDGQHDFCPFPIVPGSVPISTYDHTVNLLYTYDSNGYLIGVVINTACPAQDWQGVAETSADYWNLVRMQLRGDEKINNPNLFVLPMLGFARDQGPWDFVNGDSNRNDYQRMKKHATAIVQAVKDNYDSAQRNQRNQVELHHEVVTKTAVSNPNWRSPDTVTLGDGTQLNPGDPVPQSSQYLTYILHAIRIGDIAIVNNPCKMFIDYGISLRARSNAPITFLAQLSSDDSCQVHYYARVYKSDRGYYAGTYPGYVPSASAENENGVYSERSTEGTVSAAGGRQMEDDAVLLINTSLFP